MDSLLGRFFKGLQDELAMTTLQSYCVNWREHPTKYAIAYAVGHAIERDHQQLVYETLIDPDFRKLRADGSGVNLLRADIQSAMDYFSATKRNLLRYYQILFLGQQTTLFSAYNTNSLYQIYCQAYLQFLQLNEPPAQRKNIGISRVLNRLFPMEFKPQHSDWESSSESSAKPEIENKLELISYEIGNWRCKCGARQGHTKRYDLECKGCRISTGNGLIDDCEETCSRCGEPITYVICSDCNTRVTLDIVWRVANGDIYPREMNVPLNVSLRSYANGLDEDTFSLTLLELPVMLGISEKNGTLQFDSPGVFWMDVADSENPFFILSEEKRYDRQTEPLKVFEAVLSRTFRPYTFPKRSLKSLLQRRRPVSQESFSQGFRQRIARIAEKLSPNLTDFAFDCLVSATDSLTHNMAIMNRNCILSKNLVALFVNQKEVLLRKDALGRDDKITPTPLGKILSANLDEDGVVKVGARVYPGDVLVGVEKPKKLEEMTAEEKLLQAIFGEKAQFMEDGSLVYDGACPAQVTSVEVFPSNKTKYTAFHQYQGKTIRHTELSGYGQNVYLRISISLSQEQPIEVGDTLYAHDGESVVICRIASGVELKNLAGCAEEPDLLVPSDHPWAITSLQMPCRCSLVQAFVRPNAFIGQNMTGRASGHYALIDQQPLWQANDYDNYNIAQVMTRDDFSWLLHRNLMDIIFELLQMHSDCLDVRAKLHEVAESGSASVNANPDESFSPPTDLVEAPGQTVRYLAFLLRSLGIRVGLSEVNDFNAIRISLASPEQIRGWSYGEVTKPETINDRTLKPEKDSLFCERIFGPTKDWECYCGKYKRERFKGIVCDKCGVEVVRSKVRRERMGHIELASPVSHIWYFKGTPCRIGLLLDLSPRNLERILYFALYVVTRIDEEARQQELMRIDEELLNLQQDLDTQVVERIESQRGELDNREQESARLLQNERSNIERYREQELEAARHTESETWERLRALMGQKAEESIVFGPNDVIIIKEGDTVTPKSLEVLEREAEKLRNSIAENARRELESANAEQERYLERMRLEYQDQVDHAQSTVEKERTSTRQCLELERRDLEGLKKMDLLQENRYRELKDTFGSVFRAGMGAEAVRELIADIDMDQLAADLRKEISSTVGQRRKKTIKRLNVVEAFLHSGTSPEWMILTVLPVLPPELRLMVKLDDGRFVTSNLNVLYRRVINRNNHLKRMLELGAPEIIIRNEKRMLQENCDALFENGRRGLPISNHHGIPLRSLSECITQFKPHCDTTLDMLLKRPLDYTAQTRITVEHTGDIDVAFLPERLANELFNPFIKQSSNISNHRSIGNSDETVLDQVHNSKDTFPFDCCKFAILVSTDSSFSRFITLRFRLTHDLSLKVHDSLMDLLGWELLGSSARIFALFSNEAIEEALNTLSPSKLLQQKPPKVISDLGLDITGKNIVSFVSTKALSQELVPIGPYGWFLTTPFRYPK